ncbi:iron-sulfur cluster co-chaperone protein HscB-like [Uloborus diversus]|uniref:iron-sulfur cluster co-chaperone protein HscB-like n=1 Tax=Uloborus diversus TaxID=327109 RepID=UPI0024095D49|nr:iron-sulfur cluster co-chaperone protein HscB-like [Uloborus diversus]
MNTVFKTWGNKFVVLKLQQAWKKSYEAHNILKYSNRCSFFFINASHSSLSSQISGTRYKILKNFPLFVLGKQHLRLLNISKNRCWKCNAVVIERDLVCMSCGCVQEPRQNLNHFELFKETPHFDIDVRNLTVKFRRLQTLLHPDKIANRSETEKQYSAEQSAKVNRAYQTLLHPMDRGLYLLELHGKPLCEEEIQLPSDFLSDIMEVNETLQDCKNADTLESIRHVNEAKLQILFSDVSLSFKEKNITRARESLSKLRYFVKIDELIRKKEDELGISRDD